MPLKWTKSRPVSLAWSVNQSIGPRVEAGVPVLPPPEQAAARTPKTKNAKRKTPNGDKPVLRLPFCDLCAALSVFGVPFTV
jgi:hypothetical protein